MPCAEPRLVLPSCICQKWCSELLNHVQTLQGPKNLAPEEGKQAMRQQRSP